MLPQIRISTSLRYRLCFTLILLLGIFARLWEFQKLPPGLNQDEASSGVEAFNLYRFGIDRNGVSYPVHLISWGGGQNALYSYVLIPFIALGGLSSVTVRLPQLLFGILTLPLIFYVAKRTITDPYALLSMFLLAISPWHIMLSRWALESNLLPFVFLLGYACLLKSTVNNHWFVAANIFFALCLYTYGTAYAAVPVFLACSVPILLWSKRVSLKTTILGFVALAIVGFPIGLFVLVNTFRLNTIHVGFLTIPLLPTQPRYVTLGALFSDNPLASMAQNLQTMLFLLYKQTDGLVWNAIEPYGYFYKYSLPLSLFGAAQLLWFRRSAQNPERWLLLSWVLASVTIGVLQPVNINRINLIFIPLILCAGVPIAWIGERNKIALILSLCVLSICFLAFTRDYHGSKYRRQANKEFFAGLISAYEFAQEAGDIHTPICVTDSVNMPYIFALFTEQMNPADYLGRIEYVDPHARHRAVRSLGRYTFGMDHCPADRSTIYILAKEQPPQSDIPYKTNNFGSYTVYSP